MAGVSDGGVISHYGSERAEQSYVFEMVSVAIRYGGENLGSLCRASFSEPDDAVQLFGSKPDQFKKKQQLRWRAFRNKLAPLSISIWPVLFLG